MGSKFPENNKLLPATSNVNNADNVSLVVSGVCINEFEICENVDEKVKLFNQIQSLIKDNELELFDE